MKRLIFFLRFAVGLLFIFSGLVKANDPLGLAYKMEEYFEIGKLFSLIPFATFFSVSMNALEISSGFALCLGWNNKWNLRLLLSLIVFFTFLTGYTYYTGYPKTCGCFGDCLPIDAVASFYKDLILLGAILLLTFYSASLKTFVSTTRATLLVFAVTVFSVGLQLYVLKHLPLVDCLPYQVGTNLSDARKQPPPPPGSTVMFVYQKNGVEVEFSADQFPDDFSAESYRFIRRYETGEIPQAPIQGFVLYTTTGSDTTEAILSTENALLVFTQQASELTTQYQKEWNRLYQLAVEKKISIVLITNRVEEWGHPLQSRYALAKLVSCDRTPIRTAARVDPTLYYLEKGRVIGKQALVDQEKLLKQIH